MSNALKNVLWKVFAAAMVIVGIVWFLQDDTKPIEDTNGPDNFFLQVITDRNIIERDMGMVGGIKIRSDLIGSGITFSSDGFTGVYEVLYDNYVGCNPNVTRVSVDNWEGLELSVSYLKELGHRKIGYLGSHQTSYIYQQRHHAY